MEDKLAKRENYVTARQLHEDTNKIMESAFGMWMVSYSELKDTAWSYPIKNLCKSKFILQTPGKKQEENEK